MKPDIHPAYNAIKVTCSCGNTFTTNSTKKDDLTVEICSKCHPFYSGQQKLVQTDRIKQFADRFGGSKAKKQEQQQESAK